MCCLLYCNVYSSVSPAACEDSKDRNSVLSSSSIWFLIEITAKMRGSLGISGWSIGDYATEPVGLWQLESSRRTREMCGRIPRERHRAGSAAARSPDGRKWGHAHQAR